MKNKLFIVLGNQLFNLDYFKNFKEDHIFFLCEDEGLCTYEKHHKQKILLFLSAMRSFKDELDEENFEVLYKKISDSDFSHSYTEKLIKEIDDNEISEVSIYEVEDKVFEKKLITNLEDKVKINYLQTPMFLNSRNDFQIYLKNTKKPFMANFYKIQRSKNKILIDNNNKPVGGKWSFDEENRKKLPKQINLPEKLLFEDTKHTHHLKEIIENKFCDHPGSTKEFWLCTTRKDVFVLLDFFLKNKLENFGDYEDAVDDRDNVLFHSALSPYINIGLITPKEIVEKIRINPPQKLNSYEGYIRQIIGWREFIRGIYQNFDKKLENGNFFNHKKKLKPTWYSATTGLDPLDYSIKNALKYGWTHHIERLMILCNIMNLCEIEPKTVYKWFMEMFVDSSDWVMSPNVYGMGLFSDGGIFATKPYICGSAYFLKMMHFKKGGWCDIMDGLYWRFIEKNKIFFLQNPRLSMMVRILEKMKIERKQKIFESAEKFIKVNTYEN
ncbi:MAG: cryptochrome/photolyase family protein [Pelagibacteraceae bacterium TMED65]|nr:cryptochrome/photolyase family protein [Rickettsiales bacterium]OUU51380.1 MAG: cryptochrome/photolyase family protein [Pelagibacteraceae bacterium TMED65]|tara:strand:+ start:1433 stop:2923 length:1491 start_codon:yes stop_codon:yes gene_type:complete